MDLSSFMLLYIRHSFPLHMWMYFASWHIHLCCCGNTIILFSLSQGTQTQHLIVIVVPVWMDVCFIFCPKKSSIPSCTWNKRGFWIISIIFKYPFPQNRTGISCMKIFGLSSTGFPVYGTGPGKSLLPSRNIKLVRSPIEIHGTAHVLKVKSMCKCFAGLMPN